MPRPTNENQPSLLLDALARVLTPLVRLLIARGVTFQMASELMKRVYVDAARRHFAGDDEATATRLSLLTGLNRKEIRRLTDAAHEKRPEEMSSFASAAHHLWSSGRRWRDRDGNPKPLPRHATGRQLSFDDLVRDVTTDHRPSAVLDELKRLGFAREEGDMVMIVADAFLPQQSLADRLLALAENLEDHAGAAVVNVLSEQPPFLERSVFSDEMSVESAEKISRLARAQWKTVHDKVVEESIATEEADAAAGRDTPMRIRVGMYFYAEKKDGKDEP